MKISLYNFICVLTLFLKQELKYLFKCFFTNKKKINKIEKKNDFFTKFFLNKKK